MLCGYVVVCCSVLNILLTRHSLDLSYPKDLKIHKLTMAKEVIWQESWLVCLLLSSWLLELVSLYIIEKNCCRSGENIIKGPMALRGNKHSTDHLSVNLSVKLFIIPSNIVISIFKISNRLAEQVEVSKRSMLTVMRECRRKGKKRMFFCTN